MVQEKCGAVALLCAGVSFFALTASAAQAQSRPSTSGADQRPAGSAPESPRDQAALAEIVVTARRVDERLQDVPTSVAAMASTELRARQITSLTDIKGAVANLNVTKTAVAGGNYLIIRGQAGTSIPNVSVDSSIGLYVDGVYLGRPQSSGGNIADIERIEVLRGPQGTLFGRNASAGAVNFITRGPKGSFGVDGYVRAGSLHQFDSKIGIDTPEVAGLAARVTYEHTEIDGDVRNSDAGVTYTYPSLPWQSTPRSGTSVSKFGGHNADSVLAKVRYSGISWLTAEYKFDYTNLVEDHKPYQIQGFGPGIVSYLVTAPNAILPGTGLGLLQVQLPGNVPVSTSRLGRLPADHEGRSTVKVTGNELTLTADAGHGLSVKSISAYRTVKTTSFNDYDNVWTIPVSATASLPFCVSCSINDQNQWQLTQELQLIGKSDRLNYIVGAYYFHERARSGIVYSSFKAFVDPNNIPVTAQDMAAGQNEFADNTAYALYGHADYKVTDSLEFAVGLRNSWDERVSYDQRVPLPPGSVLRSSANYHRFNYDLAVTYHFTSDINSYLRYATGYQSGGILKGKAFLPEDSKSLELGLKSEFLDHRLRLNAAIFETKIKDQQTATFDPLLGLLVNNAGKVKVDGFEAEIAFMPIHGLTFTGNVGYAKSDNSLYDFNQAPKTTVSGSAQYDAPAFGNGMYLSGRFDADYRSKFNPVGALTKQDRLANPSLPLPAYIWAGYPTEQAYIDALFKNSQPGGYWLVNARLSMMDIPVSSGRIYAAAYVRNLFNNHGGLYTVDSGGIVEGSFETPRTYGVEVGFSF